MENVIQIIATLLLILFLVLFCLALAWIFISIGKLSSKCIHPDKCPLCDYDIEHSRACLCCPFVIEDKWEDAGDGPYTVPLSFHCGLKDKDYMKLLELESLKKDVEKL